MCGDALIKRLGEGQPVRWIKPVQALMGLGCYTLLALPYLRLTQGFERLLPHRRYLIVSNHVSLLDTILLGGLCWSRGAIPILVLGDKTVWQTSWVKQMLSAPIGFLLERGKLNRGRIRELQTFARGSRQCNLIVFPEGTRGDGVHVGPCQPGVYYIAQEAQIPIVPIFIRNMQLVSTKRGRFHLISGLRKVEVHCGEPILPAVYLSQPREEFTEFIRQRIAALGPVQPVEGPSSTDECSARDEGRLEKVAQTKRPEELRPPPVCP